MQLLLGWAAVALSSFSNSGTDDGVGSFGGLVVHIIFGLSVSMTLLIAADSILNSQSRWRQLRVGAGTLESIIWTYRTRTGVFAIDESGVASPETQLLAAVKKARTSMLSAANLATSELGKRYPMHVFKHFQDSGDPPLQPSRPLLADSDARHTKQFPVNDHQSPVQPTKYIAMRIEPAIEFYQRRIPAYARRTALLRLLIISLGVAASVLARYELIVFVVFVTSGGAAVTSWAEFTDTQRKTERYTRAVTSLRDLLDWWRSLSETQKAGKRQIDMLVATAETVINEEQSAWTSTPAGDKETKREKSLDEDSSGKVGK